MGEHDLEDRPGVLLLRPLPDDALQRLRRLFAVCEPEPGTDPRDAALRHPGAIRGLLTSSAYGASEALIDALPALAVISSFSAGLEGIAVEHARRRGVVVTNTSAVLAGDVADIAMFMVLCLRRQMLAADAFVRRRDWRRGAFPLQRGLRGARLGILGLGTIGLAVALRAQAAGMDISYTNRRCRDDVCFAFEARLTTLAAWADILVVTCPGGGETAGLVGRDVLAALGPDGYLVNVARGSVVDETALIEMLECGALGGAGLDVFADEPNVPEALLRSDRVVLSPHVGSGTVQARAAMGNAAIDSLAAILLPAEHRSRSL